MFASLSEDDVMDVSYLMYCEIAHSCTFVSACEAHKIETEQDHLSERQILIASASMEEKDEILACDGIG